MSERTARRFYSEVATRPEADGWTVTLDARPVRTPGKHRFLTPTLEMARAAADEWRAQSEQIDPRTMPVTRAVNSAIDRVMPQHVEVAANLAKYGETDLLCYRAEDPDALTTLQAREWDPLLDWAAEALGARLVPVAGVMPRPQDPAALGKLAGLVREMDAFELTAFYDLVALSGSLILGFAVSRRRIDASEAWRISRLDEAWQAERWGRDSEAEAAATIRRQALLDAERFGALARGEAPQP